MYDEFRHALRQARLAAGLKQAALARKMEYSKGHVSRVEKGQRNPTYAFAKAADAALGANGALLAIYRVAVAPRTESMPDGNSTETSDRRIDALTLRVDALYEAHRRHHPEDVVDVPSPRGEANAGEETAGVDRP